MEDLTIIEGQNEKFVLIDTETNANSLTAYYVRLSQYAEGYFDDSEIIEVTIDYVSQGRDVIVGGWEYPLIEGNTVRPGSDLFDYDEAEKTALEVANQLILNYESEVVDV